MGGNLGDLVRPASDSTGAKRLSPASDRANAEASAEPPRIRTRERFMSRLEVSDDGYGG
jgi:hypothetical protein